MVRLLGMLCFLAFITLGNGHCVLSAQAKTSTQAQIDAEEKEKQDLEQKQDQNEQKLDNLKDAQKSLAETLEELNEQLAAAVEALEALEKQIGEKEEEIEVIKGQVEDTKQSLILAVQQEDAQYEAMVTRIRWMYEYNETGAVNAILSGSYTKLLNAEEYFRRVEEYDQRKLAEYRATKLFIASEKERLLEEQAELEQEQAELLELNALATEEKNKFAELIDAAKSKMSSYENQIDSAEKKALEYEKQIQEKESNIEALKEKLKEEMAKSLQASQGVWRDISEVTFEDTDRTLLANLIYCEAGGEPYEGQIAVGAVVINRVLSAVYPNTVSGVIYQKGQFSPVASGRLALALANNKATESCYNAADEAMRGVTNVENRVYFRTPIEGLTGLQIGGHIFY